MIREEEVFPIGRLGKPHGVHGELTMQVADDVFDRVEADCLVLRVDGIFVPFYLEEYRFRTDTTALVKFEGVDTVERARELTNTDVFFLRRLSDESGETDYSSALFIGFDIVDASSGRVIGRIVDIDDATANVLFCLEDGLLIPANADLVSDIDTEHRRITMQLPEGLLTI